MSTRDTTKRASVRKGAHRWAHSEQLCIHLLRKETELSWSQTTALFNAIFREDLVKSGEQDGLSLTQVTSQYNMRNGGHAVATWEPICHPSTPDDHQAQSAMRARIIAVRASTTIHLDESDTIRLAEPTSADELADVSSPTNSPSTRERAAPAPDAYLNQAGGGDNDTPSQLGRGKRKRKPSKWHGNPMPTTREPTSADESKALLTQRNSSGKPPKKKTEALKRHNMTPLPVTPKQKQDARAQLCVEETHAHPLRPRYVFRVFSRNSQGINSPHGFMCGNSMSLQTAASPPPPCKDVMGFVIEHINPTWIKDRIPCDREAHGGSQRLTHASMFISTTSDLIWAIRSKAISEMNKTGIRANEVDISVIDTWALDEKSVYYAHPFLEEFRRKMLYHNDKSRAWTYRGYSEFLIWDKIPGHAVVKMFTFQELTEFADGGDVGRLLRLPELVKRGCPTSAADLRGTMKEKELRITREISAAIAEFMVFLGLGVESSFEELEGMFSEIVNGWVLDVHGVAADEWEDNAESFERAFCRASKASISAVDQKLKVAYFAGLRWSLLNCNVRIRTPQAHHQMRMRAEKARLPDPVQKMAEYMAPMQDLSTQLQHSLAAPIEIQTMPARREILEAPDEVSGNEGLESDMESEQNVVDVSNHSDDESIIFEA